jgi:hypothetical protein
MRHVAIAGLWRSLLLLAAALACVAVRPASAADIAFAGGASLRLASVEEGAAALSARDEWLQLCSDWHRAALLRGRKPDTEAALQALLARAALAWTREEASRIEASARRLAPRFEALGVPLPKQVLKALPPAGQELDYLLAHELFHVMSRRSPALATRLYALIGFEPAPEFSWPQELQAVRIVNPDAPHHRHAMRLPRPEGGDAWLMPILVAKRPVRFDAGETFFDVLELTLVEVVPEGRSSRARRTADGKVSTASPALTRAYMDRLGGNTGYVIHPEETMADNFAFLVAGIPVRQQALLERIEAVFRSQ